MTTAACHAISLWQPWASLWLIPEAKLHETRHWRLPERLIGQRGLVHAAKKKLPRGDIAPDLEAICARFLGADWRETVPYGAFVGAITFAASLPMTDMFTKPAHENDWMCGHWAPGRYAWLGADPRVFSPPVPAVGHQGFWLAGVPSSLLDPVPVAARKALRLHLPEETRVSPGEAWDRSFGGKL